MKVCDFSDTPGGRYAKDGPYSGEEFREKVLIPLWEKNDEQIVVDLDGVEGYTTGFLEEVFGGLARKFGKRTVLRRLRFVSKDEMELETEIRRYICEIRKIDDEER